MLPWLTSLVSPVLFKDGPYPFLSPRFVLSTIAVERGTSSDIYPRKQLGKSIFDQMAGVFGP